MRFYKTAAIARFNLKCVNQVQESIVMFVGNNAVMRAFIMLLFLKPPGSSPY